MIQVPMTRGQEEILSPILKEFLGWVAEGPEHTSQSLLDMWIERDQIRIKFSSR